MKLKKEKLNRESLMGTIYVLMSAVCFSLGGVLIKLIPWSSMTIQGVRSIFSSLVIGGFMLLRHQKLVINKTVLSGAAANMLMALAFVSATKMTTAANVIVLQFTAPIFVIVLSWFIFKKRPGKEAVSTCFVVFAGILCFFFDSLGAGKTLGNLLAIFSGFCYALVMMMKAFPRADFESALLFSNLFSIAVGIPFYAQETETSVSIWAFAILLGVIQCGFSYVFLSMGLDRVSPITASLTSAVEPILNPTLVAVFCGETMGTMAAVGAILVVGATVIYNFKVAQNN